MVGVYLGICFGLISAVAIGALIDVISNALGIADAQGPTPPKYHRGGVALNLALSDFTAQAPSESVRGPQIIGKR